jgi:hypothetical protein
MLFLYDMRFSALTRGDCLGQFLLFKQFIGSHFIVFNFNLIPYWVLPYLVLSVMTSTFHDGIAKMSWETRELDMSSTTKAGAKTFITVYTSFILRGYSGWITEKDEPDQAIKQEVKSGVVEQKDPIRSTTLQFTWCPLSLNQIVKHKILLTCCCGYR